MKVEHEGKVYTAKRDPKTGRLFANKKFAGFGPGNMNKGFKVVKEVQEHAPVKKDS